MKLKRHLAMIWQTLGSMFYNLIILLMLTDKSVLSLEFCPLYRVLVNSIA